MIEALGVPHTEVEIILANGESVNFSYQVQSGDRIAVYPHYSSIDTTSIVKVRLPYQPPYRFILDNHLGRLVGYLRLLGFDAVYQNNYDDDELADIAHQENRILLTRDRGLLKRSIVTYGFCLTSREPKNQLRAVIQRFKLHDHIDPWKRCLKCNGRIYPVPKEAVLERLEPKTKRFYNEFFICEACDQIYWKGSHFTHMQEFLDSLT